MTDAALGVLSAHPGQPFILFVEAGESIRARRQQP